MIKRLSVILHKNSILEQLRELLKNWLKIPPKQN